MRIVEWLVHEAKAVALATCFFGVCFLVAALLKTLLLAEYDLRSGDYLSNFVLALVTAKVVVIFDRVSFGRWIGLAEVLLRTVTYSVAAFVLMLIEHAASTRHDAGGFMPALIGAFRHPDAPRIWATLICVALAFAAYAAAAVLRRELGAERISAAFLKAPAAVAEHASGR